MPSKEITVMSVSKEILSDPLVEKEYWKDYKFQNSNLHGEEELGDKWVPDIEF